MANDSFTREGAMGLKRSIELYWAKQGYSVTVDLRLVPFVQCMRSSYYVLASDLHNGWPVSEYDSQLRATTLASLPRR